MGRNANRTIKLKDQKGRILIVKFPSPLFLLLSHLPFPPLLFLGMTLQRPHCWLFHPVFVVKFPKCLGIGDLTFFFLVKSSASLTEFCAVMFCLSIAHYALLLILLKLQWIQLRIHWMKLQSTFHILPRTRDPVHWAQVGWGVHVLSAWMVLAQPHTYIRIFRIRMGNTGLIFSECTI